MGEALAKDKGFRIFYVGHGQSAGMKDLAKMLNRAEQLKRSVDELIGGIEVKDSGEHRVGMMLMLTIAEQYFATLHLFRCGSSSHAPIMAKSMHEALVSLELLVKDPKHADQMRFKDASENIRLCNDYANDPDTQQDQAMVKLLADLKSEAEAVFNELQANGFKKRQIENEFALAGIKDNYLAYRVYCGPAHNQLTALMARHAGNPLRYHEEPPVSSKVALLSCIVSMLARAVHTLPIFTTAKEAEVTELVDDANEGWKEFLAS
jgi:hypothetical protein